ncbi:MAG: ATP-dependent DNA helicase RecG [Lachnospiraceae bacterium]|nr:ATP-dependent DNA helicase RecG [Lachnospiraceae bacterium]
MQITDSIMAIKGIGEKNAAFFRKLNIDTIASLLYHFPRDYELMPKAAGIREGAKMPGAKKAVLATVKTKPVLQRFGGKSKLSFDAADGFGCVMKVTYFNMPYLASSLWIGKQCVFYGSLTEKGSTFLMAQPKLYSPESYEEQSGKLYPVYAKTKGLSDAGITKAVGSALSMLEEGGAWQEEYLPDELVKRRGFDSVKDSLHTMHFPVDRQRLQKARERFSYEELLLFLLSVKSQSVQKTPCSSPMKDDGQMEALIQKLPYQLTGSQHKAVEMIREDLCGGFYMNRLLQGDVGSGKTIVAFLAMLLVVSNGYQTVLMAPTEVLAKQHYEQLSQMTKELGLPFKPAFLAGSSTAKEKRQTYEALANGTINTAIGTHALIQEPVAFQNLGLVITDEQHRFGVRQREILHEKGGGNVHTLVMSATPIPRSLAIVLYGQLSVTQMTDMPAERLPIKNCVVDQGYRPSAYKFMMDQIRLGRQVYVICPMAEPGVMEELENVVDYAKHLGKIFPESVRIAHLHGKMRPKQKNEIMEAFATGQIDILVSTTVIEVGVNVPNATVMMVENAERFGLATLHQIRGRVGRGSEQSYCIFMESETRDKKNERLEILNHSNNGFEIAEKDLKLRGPGDLMGLEQSGSFSFRFADIYRDHQLLLDASADADELLAEDPGLSEPVHLGLKERLSRYQEEGYLDIL